MSADIQTSDFFVAGGTLHPGVPSYVKRPADDELFDLALAGEFCYVLTPRQMGKSSLMIRAARRLQAEGVRSAIIDLTAIGTGTADTWYLDLVSELADELDISTDAEAWWQAHASLGPVRRFVNFLHDIVLAEITERVVIFIDEIDTTLKLDFRDDFFAAIRAMYNARAQGSEFEHLTFVLLGVASPTDLIADRARTPFNIGQAIALQEFSRKDARVLQAELEAGYPDQGVSIFNRIYYWTSGHPYLTQKLCLAVTKAEEETWPDEHIDTLVNELFLAEEAYNEANLKFVQDKILTHPKCNNLLGLYRKVHSGKIINDEGQSLLQNHLKLSGLVRTKDKVLSVRNEIYKNVFDPSWIKENITTNWLSIVTIFLIVIVLGFTGIFSYNIWVDIYYNECFTGFYEAESPGQRLIHLAEIFKLRSPFGVTTDYDYRAQDLFFGLSREEQLVLFDGNHLDATDITVVTQGLYTTLADVNNIGSTTALLEAMSGALGNLKEAAETTRLKMEIDMWIEGRIMFQQRQYTEALKSYDAAIALNTENPSTLYERAKVLLALAQYEQVLNDLDRVIAITQRSAEPTPMPPPLTNTTITSISSPIVTLTPDERTILAPTLTPGVSISPIGTPTFPGTVILTETPGFVSEISPIQTPSTVPIVTSIPTFEPERFTSQFMTFVQVRNAVHDLINENQDTLIFLKDNPNLGYVNLSEFGLIPPYTELVIKGKLIVPSSLALSGQSVLFLSTLSIANQSLTGEQNVSIVLDGQSFSLYDDGSHGDWQPNDGLYTILLPITDTGTVSATLFINTTILDALSLNTVDDPRLLVLTDWNALYAEFRDTGMNIQQDTNQNGVHDLFDLVERLNLYTSSHRGIVVDLAISIMNEERYSADYAGLDYGMSTATRLQMGHLVDELIANLNIKTGNSVQNVVLLGDDQVIPFYRIFDPTDFYEFFNQNYPDDYYSRERDYPETIGGMQANPTLIDTENGYIMSDLPYSIRTHQVITEGTWLSALPNLPEWASYPVPNMGIGRVFSSHPFQLIEAINKYETPLFLAPEYASAAVFIAKGGVGINYAQLAERNLPQQFMDQLQIYDAAISAWNPEQFVGAIEQNDLVWWWGDGNHQLLQIDESNYLTVQHLNTVVITKPVLFTGFGSHLGYTVGHYPDSADSVLPYENALLKPLIAQGVTCFAPSGTVYTWGEALPSPNLSEPLINRFITLLIIDDSISTIGEAWRSLFSIYHSTDPAVIENNNPATHLFHISSAYGIVLYGLPTQPIQQ